MNKIIWLISVLSFNLINPLYSMEKSTKYYIANDKLKTAQPDLYYYNKKIFVLLFKDNPDLADRIFSNKVTIHDLPALQKLAIDRGLFEKPLFTYLIYNENQTAARPVLQFTNNQEIIVDHDTMMKNLFSK